MISEGKKRITLTFPAEAIEAFKKDAARLNMTLSSYAFVVLAANSYSMDSDFSCDMCDRLSDAQEAIWFAENQEVVKEWEARKAAKTS